MQSKATTVDVFILVLGPSAYVDERWMDGRPVGDLDCQLL